MVSAVMQHGEMRIGGRGGRSASERMSDRADGGTEQERVNDRSEQEIRHRGGQNKRKEQNENFLVVSTFEI